MSGSGGNRNDGYPSPPLNPIGPTAGGGGAGGGAGGEDPCDILQTAPLNSPQAAVVGTLNVGDILDVVLNKGGVRAVLEVHLTGQVAGSLTHRGHVAIINCIEQGNQYQAVVTRKQGGAVELRIERA